MRQLAHKELCRLNHCFSAFRYAGVMAAAVLYSTQCNHVAANQAQIIFKISGNQRKMDDH